uniref:Uncharacterized protein n=1 Tax=Triticum urartu TaxID=4572 RepID=A0A8R7U5I9_TRIUA
MGLQVPIRRWPEVICFCFHDKQANGVVKKLEKDESLDWDKYIKENNKMLRANCHRIHCLLGFLSVFAHHYACKNCDDCLAS